MSDLHSLSESPGSVGREPEVEGTILPRVTPAGSSARLSDPDFWYEEILRSSDEPGLLPASRCTRGEIYAELYRTALASVPAFADLLAEFENSGGGQSGVPVRKDHEAYFAVSAALIGVQANSAYRSLVVHIRRFAGATNPRAVALFETLVPQSRYDQMRRAKHGLSLSRTPCPPEAVLALYTRYELLLGHLSKADDPDGLNRHAGIPSQ